MHILNYLVILQLLVSVQIEADRKIFQGKEVATTKDVPFIVSVWPYSGKSKNGMVQVTNCAGSYILPYWVISAAHCIKSYFPLDKNKPKNRVVLCMGTVHPEKCHRKNTRYADALFPYIEGDPAYKKHDILLIHIKRPFIKGPTINFVKLPTTKVNKESLINKECLIAGWGIVNQKNHNSKILKVATVKIIEPNLTVCGVLSKTQICAEFLTGISCGGDSGGPLLCDNTLIGVLQGGTTNCGTTERKSVYQLIPEHQGWIINVTDNYMSSATRIIVPNNLCIFIFYVTLLFSIISIF